MKALGGAERVGPKERLSQQQLRCIDRQAETLEIFRQAVPSDRFLIGITEDVPEEYWRKSFQAINACLNTYRRLKEADS